jgi:hypothetical protein
VLLIVTENTIGKKNNILLFGRKETNQIGGVCENNYFCFSISGKEINIQ